MEVRIMSNWIPTEQELLWMQAKAYGRLAGWPARVGTDLTGKVDVTAELSIIDTLPTIPSVPFTKIPSIPSIDEIKSKITNAVSSGDVGNLPVISGIIGKVGPIVSAAKDIIENAESIASKLSDVKGAIDSVVSKVKDAIAALGGDPGPEPEPEKTEPEKTKEPEKPKGFKMGSNLRAQREAYGIFTDVASQVDTSREAIQRHIDDMKARHANPAAIAKLEAFLRDKPPTKSNVMSSDQNITQPDNKSFPWIPVSLVALAGLAIWKFWWKP